MRTSPMSPPRSTQTVAVRVCLCLVRWQFLQSVCPATVAVCPCAAARRPGFGTGVRTWHLRAPRAPRDTCFSSLLPLQPSSIPPTQRALFSCGRGPSPIIRRKALSKPHCIQRVACRAPSARKHLAMWWWWWHKQVSQRGAGVVGCVFWPPGGRLVT